MLGVCTDRTHCARIPVPMRPKLTRAELAYIEGKWRVILSVAGDAPDIICWCANKDHALHVVSVYLEAQYRRLPKKPNYYKPEKIIYYFR